MLRKDLHEKNRRSWNEAMPTQNSHKRDQPAFPLMYGLAARRPGA